MRWVSRPDITDKEVYTLEDQDDFSASIERRPGAPMGNQWYYEVWCHCCSNMLGNGYSESLEDAKDQCLKEILSEV